MSSPSVTLAEESSALQSLWEAERRYRELFQLSPQPKWVFDADSLQIRAVNDAAIRRYGYDEREFLAMTLDQIWSPEEIEYLRGRLQQEGDFEGLAEHITRSGERLTAEYHTACMPYHGQTVRLLAARDVTEDLRQRRELELSRQKFAQVFISCPVAVDIVTFDEGRFLEVNEPFLRLTGYSREEVLSSTSQELGIWADITARSRFIDLLRENGHVEGVLIDLVNRQTGLRRCSITAQVIESDGQTCILSFIEDQTEMLKARESEQREREASMAMTERFRLVSKATNDAIWDWDLITDKVWYNESFDHLFGMGSSDEGPDGWISRIHPEDRDRVKLTLDPVLKGGQHSWRADYRFRRTNGTYADVMDRGYVIHNSEGRPVRMVGSMMDYSERRQLEMQLAQTAKFESIGLLAGGVAHDFNNILMAIAGYAELLRLKLDRPELSKFAKYVDEISEATERGAALTSQLLSFSRKQVIAPTIFNMNTAVTQITGMIRRLIGEDIQLALNLAPRAGHVLADLGQFEQIIVNLAVNARDAMPNGGKLEISTFEDDVVTPARDQTSNGFRPGRYVGLRVSDNGIGMDKATKAKIFEPFFTTKEKGRGTGLGLAMAYGAVKQSGGYIWVDSEPGKGTTFTIYLPVAEAPAADKDRECRMSTPNNCTGTIVFVEDERSARVPITQLLESVGFSVLDAASGEEAIDLVANYEGKIDLLITDVIMPGMNGVELARRVESMRPGIKVLYISGYTDNALSRDNILQPGVELLRKPFALQALLTRIAALLPESGLEMAK